jgi:hypothetical protein
MQYTDIWKHGNITPTHCELMILITNNLVGTKTFSCNTFVNRVKTGET